MAAITAKVVKDYIAAINSHDVERIASFFTDDCVFEDQAFGIVSHGKKELKEIFTATFVASPDLKVKLKSFFSAGDWIASEWVMSGTSVGDFLGVKGTGKKWSVRGASITQYSKGKIKRDSDYYNLITILQQTGLLPGTPSQ